MIIENTINSTFIKLFEENNLTIPRYQREYEWKEENVLAILDSIFDESNWEMYLKNNKEKYFIGTLITFEKDEELNIIDGQQRTITFYLLYICIKNLFLKIINNSDLIKKKYEETSKKIDFEEFKQKLNIYCYKLQQILRENTFKLKDENQKILDKIINEEQIIGSQENSKVYINYKLLKTQLEKKFNENIENFLSATKFVMEKVVFLQVVLNTYEEAIEIFVSLNTNREELKIHELLNSLFIKDSKIEDTNLVAKRFELLLKDIKKENIANYITDFWFIKIGKKIPNSDIYKEITKYLKNKNLKSTTILSNLEESKNSYLLSTGLKKFDLTNNINLNFKIGKIIFTLNQNNHTQIRPLIMKIINLFEKKKIQENELFEMVKQIFDVSVYTQVLCSIRSQTFEHFIKQAIKLEVLNKENLKQQIRRSFNAEFKNLTYNLTRNQSLKKESKKEFTFILWKNWVLNEQIPEAVINSTTIFNLINEIDVNKNNIEEQDQYLLTKIQIDTKNPKYKSLGKTYNEKIEEVKKKKLNIETNLMKLREQNLKEVEQLENYLSTYKLGSINFL